MEHANTISPSAASGKQRVFLFLQGHPSAFWGQLFDRVRAAGHHAIRVNLCLGDLVFWGRRPAINYRSSFANWPEWLDRLCAREGVTDILYYADRLPYHVVAQDVGNARGVRCWAIEHGYLRPDWLTLERDGMGAFSHFPKDPDVVRRIAAETPAPDLKPRYSHDFPTEAFHEVTYNLLQAYGRPLYPLYFSDKPHWPAIEYLSWLPVLAREKRLAAEAGRVLDDLEREETPYNLVAMQLETDYQIRACSDYGSLREFLDEVMASFAAHAPGDRHLVIKLHPLDNGLGRWFSRIPAWAREHGIAERVHVIRGGDLHRMLRGSRGALLVNSTVGLFALREGVPTCVMGRAVFDIPGLTHQGGIDRFWTEPEPVDAELFAAFERAISTIQVKGSFYDPAGRGAAAAEIVRRLTAGTTG